MSPCGDPLGENLFYVPDVVRLGAPLQLSAVCGSLPGPPRSAAAIGVAREVARPGASGVCVVSRGAQGTLAHICKTRNARMVRKYA